MSEGYTVEDSRGIVAGIVVRQPGDQEFRFFSSASAYDALEGTFFDSAVAAQRAIAKYSRAQSDNSVSLKVR